MKALIYLRRGSMGPGMAEVLFKSSRDVGVLIYPRQGSKRAGLAGVLCNP